MKNKLKFISIILFVASFCNCANAQTDYYKNKQITSIIENGMHVADYALDDTNIPRLGCITNKKINEFLYNKTGNKIIPQSRVLRYAKITNPDDLKIIVKSVFNAEQIAEFKSKKEMLDILFVLDRSGNILEMGFEIYDDQPFMFIEPSKFYYLEQQIRASIKFKIDDRVWTFVTNDFTKAVTTIIFSEY